MLGFTMPIWTVLLAAPFGRPLGVLWIQVVLACGGSARARPNQMTFAIMAMPLVGTLSAAFIVGEVPVLLDFIAAGFIMMAIADALLPARQKARV